MSRSRKRTPIAGNTIANGRDAPYPRLGNKRLRRANHARLDQDPEAMPLVPEEVDNVYSWPTDGRKWFDPKLYPKEMRK